MKKPLVLVFLLLTLYYTPARAQQSSFFIGGSGGANLSMYGYTSDYADIWTTSRVKPGLNGGLVFGMEFNKIAIVSGVSYIQKGTRSETDNYNLEGGNVGYIKARENTSFINIPLLFRYRFLGEKFGLTLAAGPSFNIGLSGNLKLELQAASGESRSESSTVRFGNGITDSYRRFQPAFVISPGVQMPVGERGKLGLNIVWDLGGNAVNKRSSSALGADGKIINISTILSVSYTHHFVFGDKY